MTDAGRSTPGSHLPPGGGRSGDAYLWDRSGPVDAGVREVEAVAAGLGHAGAWKGVEARARGVRMARVRSFAGAAVMVLAVVGVWVGWPSERVTEYASEHAPWRFVAGRGVQIVRERGSDLRPGVSVVRVTTRKAPLELRSSDGAVVTVAPRSEVSFVESPYLSALEDWLGLSYGAVVVTAGSDGPAPRIGTGGGTVVAESRSTVRISDGGTDDARAEVVTGEATLIGRFGKASSRERMIAGTWVALHYGRQGPILSEAASTEFADAVRKWQVVRGEIDGAGAKLRDTAITRITEAATPGDVATLWNLAFEVSYDEHEREVLIGAIGRLTGEWPAVIKSTKEPYWSQTFAEEWWEVVKRAHERKMKEDAAAKTALPVRKGGGK